MSSTRNYEWSSLSEAMDAAAAMPICADCQAPVKVHSILGRYLTLCSRRPSIHIGIRDGAG